MSKEKYKQIIDEVYKNYTQNTPENHVAGSDSDPMKLSMDWKGKNDYSSGYPILERLSKEEFICKIKTDDEFSQKWGIQIEERELRTVRERKKYDNYFDDLIGEYLEHHETLDKRGVPRKIITLTYKNETIASYE